jgi:PAS domain S-box-containing protein
MPDNDKKSGALPADAPWPAPRLRALQVDELYKYAPSAAGFSYFGALLTLGVLIEAGDIGRGAVWFLWATAVTFFRCVCIVAYRRRNAGSDPEAWGWLVVAANFLAGVQWGILGTLLFPQGPVYLQLFVLMVIICFVAGSVTAYAAVKGAHEALSVPAAIPTSLYIFFFQSGPHWYAGTMALFFCFTIIFYARRLNRDKEEGFTLQLERDDLLILTGVLNQKLERENRELAHRAAVRGVSVDSARDRAARLEAIFEHSPLPRIECDASGNVLMCNPAAERLFGLRHTQLAGRPLSSLLALTDAELRALAEHPRAETIDAEAHAHSGHRVNCTASITPFPAVAGRRPGFDVVLSGLRETVA